MNNLKSLANHFCTIAALLLITLVLATACDGQTAGVTEESREVSAPLTEEALKNAEYQGIYQDAVRLTDGKYEGEPFVEGGASRPTVTFTGAYALGDLNGDGVDDAVVVLVESSGGTGNFRYLAAVLNQDGGPENVTTGLLGDRVQVESITIDAGEISVNTVTHGPDDPMCCPSQKATVGYQLNGEQLVKVSEVLAGSQEPTATEKPIAGLDAIKWTLVSYGDPDQLQAVLDGTDVTIEFDTAAGQVRGSAGCNSYFGGFEIDGEKLSISALGATMMACEPGVMEQERQYLAALEAAESFQLRDDELRVFYSDGHVLIFAAQPGAGSGTSDIVGIVWKWERFEDTAGIKDVLVDNANKYTLELRPDGTYQVQADCNLGSGGYTLQGSSLTLLPGPTTLVECEPGSQYDQYLARMGDVVTYVLDEGRLVLNLKADAGNLVFVQAEDAASTADIVDVEWKWEQTTTPVDVTNVTDPDKYTIELLSDGQFRFIADCNTGRGTYTLDDGHISFELGPMTRAACPPDSLSDQFIKELGAAAIYFLEGDHLFIDLKFDSGTMRFAPGE